MKYEATAGFIATSRFDGTGITWPLTDGEHALAHFGNDTREVKSLAKPDKTLISANPRARSTLREVRFMHKALLAFVLLTICVSMAACGGDLEVVAADVEPTSANLIGIGATQQIQVLAKFNDGRPPENVTLQSTFKIDRHHTRQQTPSRSMRVD
jgi:hypothetical protein